MEIASVISSRSSNLGGKGRPALSINDEPHTLTTFGNPFADDEEENTSFAQLPPPSSNTKNAFATVPSSQTSTSSPTTRGTGLTAPTSPAATVKNFETAENASGISSISFNLRGEGRPVLSTNDDPHTLTTFGNPFAEDEKEDTSFADMSSPFSNNKNAFTTVPSSQTSTSSQTTRGTVLTSTQPAAIAEQLAAMVNASVIPSISLNAYGGEGRPVLGINNDPHTLTMFGNPFADDEKEDTTFAYLSSLFSNNKNSFATDPPSHASTSFLTRTAKPVVSVASASRQEKGKGETSAVRSSNLAPPLASFTPVISEQPSFRKHNYSDTGPARGGPRPSPYHHASQGGGPTEGPGYDHLIPGFRLNHDVWSTRAVASGRKSASASQVIRRLRGEGLPREYWMDDETCTECYDCKSVFSTWRRKHHCRICGQIFCSRCASNIIKASRFGAEGMLRVCNLCLHKLEEEDDDEDDRRSVVSVSANFPAHQLDLMHTGHHHAAPYFTMQGGLSRSAETGNLYSIGEVRQKSGIDAFDSASRPWSPAYAETPRDPNWEESTASHIVHSPFRRGLAEDERVPTNPLEAYISASTSSAVRHILIESPVSLPTALPGQSSIVFPCSSTSSEGRRSPTPLRSRFNSFETEYDPTTAFGPNRVHSRLDLTDNLGEPGWRTRRESSACAAELNDASMQHLRTMVRQMLAKDRVPHQGEWEETLMKLALKVATHLKLSPRSFTMDARWYVKIKKLPGGAPRDSEYVDGAVITKNVAHKQMSRHIRQPRIMLVTFPFDYSRVEGQFMSFDPILAQEKEYLKNLTARVAALRPNVLLVQGPVSRLALEYLLEKKVAVARSVKPTAIQFVSRITQSDIISSMDRLVLDPRLGHCTRFRLQTFEHALIPERRKTFMRFEGCSKETGCTIILRGGDVDTLRKVKKIARFVVFIVHNLKMETYLWEDLALTLPSLTVMATPDQFLPKVLSGSSAHTLSALRDSYSGDSFDGPSSATFARPTQSKLSELSVASLPLIIPDEDDDEDSPDEDSQQRRLSHKIQTAINPYLTTFISASATLRFPPPYPIWKMKELDSSFDRVKKEWRRSVTSETSFISSVLPSQKEKQHLLPSEPFELKEVSCIAQDSQLAALRFEWQEMQRLWEWYLRKNKDDSVVEHYQKIAILTSTVPTVDLDLRPPCIAPGLEYVTFYGENDRTLGQVVEDACRNAIEDRPCGLKGCKVPGTQHSQIYIHNESRVIISTQEWPPGTESKVVFTNPMDIVTFSFCRICGKNSPYIPMTEEAKRYSFAKLLELHFYPADVRLLRGAGCFHNIYLHHIRYFAMNYGLAMQVQTDPVTVFEIIFPPMRTHVKPEELLELKNKDFAEMDKRNEGYWNSVKARVKQWESYVGVQADIVAQERGAPPLGTVMMELRERLGRERKEIADLLREAYAESAPTDTLAVGPMRTAIQNKVVFYDNEFDKLENIYFSLRNFPTTENYVKTPIGVNLMKTYDFTNQRTASEISEAQEKTLFPSASESAPPPPSAPSENRSVPGASRASEPAEPEAKVEPVLVTPKATPPTINNISEFQSASAIGSGRLREALPTSLPNQHATKKIVDGPGAMPSASAIPSFVHLKYPISLAEHIFEEAPIAVREDEPTSIIAFTLKSPKYLAALAKAAVKVSDRFGAFMPGNDGSISDSQPWGMRGLGGISDAMNEIKELPTKTHPVFHFENGALKISCTVFHAEQFNALRRSCFCEQSMIESLARCMKWDANGGRPGPVLLKTRDNRFIARELSGSELDATLRFVPRYFQYMSNAISTKRPTLLAKIFGLYQIAFKNSALAKDVLMTLLVMENLCYDRPGCQVYDLKGSSRNRLAPITPSNPNQVLLDENLVNSTSTSHLHLTPLYIREHSKRILRSTLYSDSLFLMDLNVIDYSLLVAVDESRKEIVVGMIDYIRTHSWDKMLESWVMESTAPKQYRARFLDAMERYFFLVPDRWMKWEDTAGEDWVKDDW
ncbi:hypothetical protein M407DRAFT_17916 [Tulasnella calospora MUT 4182]|uniref:1-phosphatidylinositol-3-phosphate 5-kinase n=1 Tax=Tulasnella calospora MUT 4182 TaxID=1051891 RepID=A0A0C3LHE1_9AGAM|nr:hypothetical protein M407DRAFT_17916 [Tulasnella calospora MUT 4182]